ncbi:MAG TPA: transglutaminase-like domain-containing protein [Candidatus Nanoarchaeia archaeon]|nr:transglutaminase-like domain-containing protein [Candidatus Nanoarchaeia archaeon]
MKIGVLIGIVFLWTAAMALAEDPIDNYNDYKSLRLLFTLESKITFTPVESNPKIDIFEADISFFPKENGYLHINEFKTQETPPAETEQKEYVTFRWRNPAPTEVSYKIEADITTQNKLQMINKRIKFPVRDLDDSLLQYTKPTVSIDITPEIERNARQIIGGEDDLYMVVFNLAEWTKKNIEYNLSTLTAEVVQKSSWVLQNRKGVCDELTNLFISMLRSVGIPARFVSGMVYSNLDYKWGAHGWAEVYFPEVGWVPFDVTFGQYGWIDPSHIKLKESLDSASPSAEYTWRASGVEVNMGDLSVEAKLKDKEGSQESPLKITLQPLHTEAQFGSFVPLLVTAENLVDSYVSTSIMIKKAPGLTEKNVKEILLKPGETKNIVWVLKIPDGENKYLYTATLAAQTSFGNTAEAKIQYSDEFRYYSLSDAEAYLARSTERDVKKLLQGLKMNCIPDQELYYTNDTATITCKLINTNSHPLELDICIQENCQKATVPKEEDISLDFTIKARTNGRIPIVAEDKEAVAYTYVELSTIALSDIYVTDVVPDIVEYDDTVVLKFNLNSDTEVHDITIDFKFDRFQLDKFQGTREVTIEAPGRNLRNGLKFTVSFLDEKGKAYNLEKAVYIQVNNAPWYASMFDWFAEVLGIY